MTKTTKRTESPQNTSIATEPMRCVHCGTLLGFYSEGDIANLLIRCCKCNYDYAIKLNEGTASYRHISKSATFT